MSPGQIDGAGCIVHDTRPPPIVIRCTTCEHALYWYKHAEGLKLRVTFIHTDNILIHSFAWMPTRQRFVRSAINNRCSVTFRLAP